MPTTQPTTSGVAWTPADVMTLMGLVSGVFLSGVGLLIVKVIDALKNAKIAIIAAEAAREASQRASTTASENKGQTDQLAKQVSGMQSQLTAVAMQTPPAPVSPIPPVTFPGGSE